VTLFAPVYRSPCCSPLVLRKADPDLPPDESHLMQRARLSKKLSSHPHAARKAPNCSAKKMRQKIVELPLSKSGGGWVSAQVDEFSGCATLTILQMSTTVSIQGVLLFSHLIHSHHVPRRSSAIRMECFICSRALHLTRRASLVGNVAQLVTVWF
jgi:hypothetical protein